MKYLVLGDIHGQYKRLNEILSQYFDKSDKVIFLGDYIDRGEESLKCLKKVLELKKNNLNKVELLWGNHDIFLINSMVYKDENMFFVWFYLNKAWESTFKSYMKDNVLGDYDKSEDEISLYHKYFINDKDWSGITKELLDLGKLYYKDENAFFIHGGLPTKILDENNFKTYEFYSGVGEKSIINLERDYKGGIQKSVEFFSGTNKKHDPTWYEGAILYDSLNENVFKKLLALLGVNKMFLGHRFPPKKIQYPKGDLLECLNLGDEDIGFFYGEISNK